MIVRNVLTAGTLAATLTASLIGLAASPADATHVGPQARATVQGTVDYTGAGRTRAMRWTGKVSGTGRYAESVIVATSPSGVRLGRWERYGTDATLISRPATRYKGARLDVTVQTRTRVDGPRTTRRYRLIVPASGSATTYAP